MLEQEIAKESVLCRRDTSVLGLHFRDRLLVKVLLGKFKALVYSRFEPSCMVFGVHRGRSMKHNGGNKSCKRKGAPNVTRPHVCHSF